MGECVCATSSVVRYTYWIEIEISLYIPILYVYSVEEKKTKSISDLKKVNVQENCSKRIDDPPDGTELFYPSFWRRVQ